MTILFWVNNYAIRDARDLHTIWESFPTRFLLMYSYALNFAWGGLDVFGYHLVNIIIHVLNTFLVFLLTRELLTVSEAQVPEIPHKLLFSCFTALIFLCHPIQTQAVAYIAQRGTSLSAFFYLLTILFYIKSQKDKFYYYLSVGAMFLGAMSKENIITIPILIFFYMVFWGNLRKAGGIKFLKEITPYFFPIILVIISFGAGKKAPVAAINEQLTGGHFRWDYFLTEVNVLMSYLRLFILPLNQSHIYDYPIVKNVWEPQTLLSLTCVTILLLSPWYFFRTGKKLLGFSILWFFVTLSVELITVIFIHMGLMYDHWLYLASVGLSVIGVYICFVLIKDAGHLRVVMFLLISALSFLTFQRNKIWMNEVVFWQDAVKNAPYDYTAHQFLALALFRKGQYEPAMQESMRILRWNPNDTQILNNIGVYYLSKGEEDLALNYFKRAVDLNPNCYPVHNNLAKIYTQRGEMGLAIIHYERAIQAFPQSPTAYYDLGKCYLKLNQKQKAANYLDQAKKLYRKRHQTDKLEEICELKSSLESDNRP